MQVPTEPDEVSTPPNRTFRSALRWSYVMDGGRQAITMLVTLVLAGLLGPTAFGTVAMATVYILFVQMLLQQGMIPALIQRKDLRPEHLDSAFWMVMGTSGALTIASIGLSGWWASVNRLPDLQAVISVLSILIPVKGLVVVQEARLRRNMDFRPLAIRTTASVLVGGIVGVVLAVRGFGVWAIVGQQLTTGIVELVVLWSITNWRPRLRFSRRCARELLGFSAGSSLASFGVFVNNRSDALLIGLFFGPAAVGLYRFASRWVDMLIEVSVRSLQAVSLPELSRLQHDSNHFEDRLLAVLRLSSLLALPALGILAAASDPLMTLVGPEWSDAVVPLQILCGVGAVKALTLFNGPMLQALGKTRSLAGLAWVAAILSALGFVLAAVVLRDVSPTGQVSGMAVSRLVLYGVVFLAMNLVLLLRVSGLSLAHVVGAVSPATASALAAVALGRLADATSQRTGLAAQPRLAVVVLAAGVGAAIALATLQPRWRIFISNVYRHLTHDRIEPQEPVIAATAAPLPESAQDEQVVGFAVHDGHRRSHNAF